MRFRMFSCVSTGVLLAGLFLMGGLVGCVAPQPKMSLVEASKIPEPDPQPRIVQIVKPVPMPGQLKKTPVFEPVQKVSQTKPWQVIELANKEARQSPVPEGYFNAIMTYDYSAGALYQLYGAPLRLTDIQLQPGEKIIGIPAAGDTVRWLLGIGNSMVDGKRQQHVLIKPKRAGLKTTLEIFTDRRTYHLELSSYKNTYMAVIDWLYPQDELKMAQDQVRQDDVESSLTTATNINLENLNFDYDIKLSSGNPVWKPLQVFDDGRKVFIHFPKARTTHEAPALFIVSKEGETQLVNYRVKNDFYIVDRLFDVAELRIGQKNPVVVRITSTSSAGLNKTFSFADNLD